MVTTVVCLVRTTYGTWTFPDVETNVVSHAGISLLWLEELFTTFLLRLQQSAESKTEESLSYPPHICHIQYHPDYPEFPNHMQIRSNWERIQKKSALISSARGWPRYTELLLLDLCRNLRECLTRPTATRVQSPVTLPAGWSSSFPLWGRQLLTRPPNPAPPHGVPGLGNGLQWSVLAQDHCVCCPP